MDALSLLALQIEWGADEALLLEPVSRLHAPPAEPIPARAPPIRETRRDQEPPAGPLAPGMPPTVDPVVASPPPRPGIVQARGPAATARAMAEAVADLDALRAAIAGFDASSLRDTATRTVLPQGAGPTAIAILGEVPDEDEDRAGHPFAGRAGDLLDRMLGSIGLGRGALLIVPLIPWRPPGGRAPSPLEMAACLPFAERALVLAQPRFILCMGSRPARTVADSVIRAGAGWRKPVIDGLPDGARALPMRHPNYLLSHLPARKDAWADLIRLRRALDMEPVPITAA